MDFIIDILAELFKDTDFLLPVLIAFAILSSLVAAVRHLSNKKYPRYLTLANVPVAMGLVSLDFYVLLYNWHILYFASVLLICVPIAICMWQYFSIQRKLKNVKHLAEPKNIDFNIVAAWKLLQSLSPKKMIPKQRKQYKRYRLFLLIKLGNISAVDAIINEFKEEEAYYHFMKHIKYFTMGKTADAVREIKSAEEVCTADTDSLTRLQILLNRGVSHVSMKNYKPADDYFYKAAEYYKKHRMHDKELLAVLYYNYAFNKARLGGDAWKDVLEEYKSYLNLKKVNDCISYFNIRLELLRQTNTDRAVTEKAVQESFALIMKCKFPKENECVFVSSVARVVWSARINPSACLDSMTYNLETLRDLPMPARYNAFKNIDLLFMDLHGNITESHDKLRETAYYYMLNQAENDLESYRKNLPEEAILEKCFCYMELAGLQKRLPKSYDFSEVLSYLKNVIALYHENALFVDEHICRMAIMDELCAIENLDKDYKLTKPEEMHMQLNAIEIFLPSLEEHPALAEFYLRLSFYCIHLDDYDKCAIYYNKFRNTLVSLEHFAPWLHRYHMVTSFAVRAIYFKKAIEEVKESKEIVKYVPEVQEWFKAYPNHDGMITSMLLGKFLGYTKVMPLKIKMWIDPNFNNGKSPRDHAWLWLDVLHLNIDISYQQFAGDKHPDCIFYDEDRHPLETNESYKIGADGMATGLYFKGAIVKLFSEADLPLEQKRIYDSMYSIIISHVDSECPTLERIAELYEDTMLPVGEVS